MRIIGLEAKLSALKNGFRFSGFLDRIERRGTMTYILDYKSGSSTETLKINLKKLDLRDRQTWNDAIGSFQLPIYTLLYSETAQESVQNIVPAYLLLGAKDIDEGIEIRLYDDEGRSDKDYKMLETILFALLREINDVNFPFSPPQHPDRLCPSCPFTVLCGTQWIKGWKRE